MGVPIWRPKSPPASRKRHRDALRAGEAASRGLERRNAIRLRGPRRIRGYDNLHNLAGGTSRTMDPMDIVSRIYSNTDLPRTAQESSSDDSGLADHFQNHSIWSSMTAPEQLSPMLNEYDLDTYPPSQPYSSIPARYAPLSSSRLSMYAAESRARAAGNNSHLHRTQSRLARLVPPGPLPSTVQNYTVLPSSTRTQPSRPQVHFTNPPVAGLVEVPPQEEAVENSQPLSRSPLSRAATWRPDSISQSTSVQDEDIDHRIRWRDMDLRTLHMAGTPPPPPEIQAEPPQRANWIALAEARTRSRLLQLQLQDSQTTPNTEREKPETE